MEILSFEIATVKVPFSLIWFKKYFKALYLHVGRANMEIFERPYQI